LRFFVPSRLPNFSETEYKFQRKLPKILLKVFVSLRQQSPFKAEQTLNERRKS
jgi:hypothetical protein